MRQLHIAIHGHPPKVDRFRRHPLAVLSLHITIVAALTTTAVTSKAPPLPQLLTTATGRTVPTTVISIAVITFLVLVLLCVLVNRWRSSSADADASAGGQQGSIRRCRRGLDPAALAALPVMPYAEIRKHKSGGGLECAVCLTAFDDVDELRLLPQCSYAFHPDCIDPWLQGHITCPLCRANLENPVPPPMPLSSPEREPQTPESIAVPVEVEDDEERKEEAVELEKLRCVRRAARMRRSRSTGHAVSTTVVADVGDKERFTVRLPPRVREGVLKSRRLRHTSSLVISLGGASDCAGSSTTCSVGGERCHGARRRWAMGVLHVRDDDDVVVVGTGRRGRVGAEERRGAGRHETAGVRSCDMLPGGTMAGTVQIKPRMWFGFEL